MKGKTFALGTLITTAVVCLAAASKSIPIGIPGEWVWRYADVSMSGRLWAPLLSFELMVCLLILALRWRRRVSAMWAIALVVATFVLQIAFGHVGKAGIQDAALVTMIPSVSGYHACSTSVSSPTQFLQYYADYIADMELTDPLMHVCQHPPGPVLYHWAVNRFFEWIPSLGRMLTGLTERFSPETIFDTLGVTLSPIQRAGIWGSAFGLMLSCGITALLAYLLGLRLFGHRAGAFGAILTALIPSYILFSPYFDQTYSVFALLTIWLALRAADGFVENSQGRAVIAAFLGGLALFVGMFCGTALAVVGFMAAVVLCVSVWGRWTNAARVCMAAGLGFAAPIVVLYLVFGCNMLEIWAINLRKHATFYELYPRTYWKWFIFNFVEFALFMGVPVAAMGCRQIVRLMRGITAGNRACVAVGLSLVVAIALLSVLGKNLSEVARLWMFFMPFVAVFAGKECASLFRRHPGWASAVVIAQFAQAAVFKTTLDVFGIYS